MPGKRSSATDDVSGRISQVHTSSTRRGPKATAGRAHLYRLLRLHDGRFEVARHRLAQLRHSGRQRLPGHSGVVLGEPVQALGLGNAIDVVQLGRMVTLAPRPGSVPLSRRSGEAAGAADRQRGAAHTERLMQ